MILKKYKDSEIVKFIPTFIKMCQNNIEGTKHKIKKPLTYGQFISVETLISKLRYLDTFVLGNTLTFTAESKAEGVNADD